MCESKQNALEYFKLLHRWRVTHKRVEMTSHRISRRAFGLVSGPRELFSVFVTVLSGNLPSSRGANRCSLLVFG